LVPPEWLPDRPADGVQAPDLATLLERGPRIRLAPAHLFGRVERRRIAGLLALLLVLAGGATVTQSWLEARQHADLAARRALQVQPVPRRPAPVLPVAEPWNDDAPPLLWADSCLQALRTSLLAVPGWRWTEAVCDGRRALVRYARQDGSAGLARQWWAANRTRAAELRTVSAEQLTIETPMQQLRRRAAERPVRRAIVAAMVLDRFERARLPFAVADPTTAPAPATAPAPGSPLPVPALQLSLSGALLPLGDLAEILAAAPGVSLRQATLRNAGAVPAWDLTATIHLQPDR
jgi:hypothetical protein